jgi:hypothetical protein
VNKLKHICLTFIHGVRQRWLQSKIVTDALERKRRPGPNEHEFERLDRLRNPSKYLGK